MLTDPTPIEPREPRWRWRLLDACVPPAARAEPRMRLRYRGIARSLLAISAVVSLLFAAFALLQGSLDPRELALFAAGIAFPIIGVALLRLTGSISLSLIVTNLAGIAIVGVWAYLSGGIRSMAMPWFLANLALLATFGSVLLIAVTGSALALVLVWLYGATVWGWLPPSMVDPANLSDQLLLSTLSAAGLVVFAGVLMARDRERSKARLRDARHAAERANRVKSEFLSAVSHDLRGPLSGVLGFAEVLRRDRAEPLSETQSRRLAQIERSAEVLLEMVRNLLDVNRIELGQIAIELQAVNLDEELGHCCTLMHGACERRGLELVAAPRAAAPARWASADPDRLRQVLLNLLSNAAKFNREGGRIEVAIAPQGEWLRLSVTDTGPGIAQEHHQRIFDAFERLGAGKTSTEGSGIGLTIARRLIELMGGRIGLDSRLNAGSTFWIELKRAEAPAAQATKAPAPALAARGEDRQVQRGSSTSIVSPS